MKFASSALRFSAAAVAPLVGAWIEIAHLSACRAEASVAPLVGAWIEICVWLPDAQVILVAPLVGAWIEITIPPFFAKHLLSSLPSWERGLKSVVINLCTKHLGRSPRGSVD